MNFKELFGIFISVLVLAISAPMAIDSVLRVSDKMSLIWASIPMILAVCFIIALVHSFTSANEDLDLFPETAEEDQGIYVEEDPEGRYIQCEYCRTVYKKEISKCPYCAAPNRMRIQEAAAA